MSRQELRRSRRSTWIWVALTVLVTLAAPAVWAELKGPNANDRDATLAVVNLMRKEHLTRHPLDDEISGRALRAFLKALDEKKVYFNASDVKEFEAFRTRIDDLTARGNLSPAYDIYERFLERVDQRVKFAEEILKLEHDFSLDEDLVINSDAATYAESDEAAFDLWRRRIKYELLLLKAEGKEGDEAREKLTRRYHTFAKRMHQMSDDELLELYLTSITTSYDPHTTYMSAASAEDFKIQMRLQLDGIGAALQSEDGYTTISKLVPGGAAAKEGSLKPMDRIIGVAQGNDSFVDVVDMKLKDVVKLIRGPRNTVVRLQVISDGETDPKIITITRASIELTDSEAKGEVFESGKKADGQPYKIGVINLPSFYMDMEGARERRNDFKSTTRDCKLLLESFSEAGVDAVVVDLRRNGGGALQEAINLTGLFVDQGPIVQVKGAQGPPQAYDDTSPGVAWSGPLVVMISKFSASASEIFAGAIQDYGRGLIVGDKQTHGKGTVQSLVDLTERSVLRAQPNRLGELKITQQQFYRPNGDSTQNRGVLSDVELPSLSTHLDVGESDLDYALPFDRVERAAYENLHMVDPTVITRLQTQSQERCKSNEKFQKDLKNIERYLEKKNRKAVSVKEEAFMAEWNESKARTEEEKKIDEELAQPSDKIKRDHYLDEVFNVTIDYMQSRTVAKADRKSSRRTTAPKR